MNAVHTIRLGGVLGDRFGDQHELAIGSAAEAVNALCKMVAGFERFLWEAKDAGLTFAVYVNGRNISRDQLVHPADGEIRIVPVIIGAKNGGVVMTILGAVLVVVGIFLIWTPFGAPLIGAGAGMMAGGIAMLLAPQLQDSASDDDADERASYAFNGPINTQAQGGPVALFYGGPMYIGSTVISASIDVSEQAYVPVGGSSSVGGGGSAKAHEDALDEYDDGGAP